jgi:2-oxoglutarate-Fe(II)-dependent oxygenase superfamily protein
VITTVRNFLPAAEFARLTELWAGAQWAAYGGPDGGYYNTEAGSFDGRGLPGKSETYQWRTARADPLAEAPEVKAVVARLGAKGHFCYAMGAGDHFRVHSDAYFGGGYSAILYLDDWLWDWGGLLHAIGPGGAACEVVLPEANVLALIPNGTPHFVSPVQPWAAHPRRTLSLFGVEALPVGAV